MGSTGKPIGKLGTEVARLSLTSSSISLLRASVRVRHLYEILADALSPKRLASEFQGNAVRPKSI